MRQPVEAFRIWLTESKAAFERAVKDAEENGASSMGQDVTDDVIYILERYARFAQEAPDLLSAANLPRIEQSFWLAKH